MGDDGGPGNRSGRHAAIRRNEHGYNRTGPQAEARHGFSRPRRADADRRQDGRRGVRAKRSRSITPPAGHGDRQRRRKRDKADVDLAVAAARRAFDDGRWAKVSPTERGKLLWSLADLIERDLEELAELESIDNGKPYAVARVADLPLAVDMFRYMAGWATKITGSTLPLSLPGEYLSYTLREPVGVVGQIIPWNFPLLMAAGKWRPRWRRAAPSC